VVLVVDPSNWLDRNGNLPDEPRLRRRMLRVARFIEYGGPLLARSFRETLVECSRRPQQRKACPGLMWVRKDPDESIIAFCMICKEDEMVIHSWQDTLWAEGMMEPMHEDHVPQLN
jgi:hypothetical protein